MNNFFVNFFFAISVVILCAPLIAQDTAFIEEQRIKEPSVQEKTINLQATVKGNQEQPKVLYILPWQSPPGPELGIDAIDNQQQAAFKHVERAELLRTLDSATVIETIVD